MVTDRYAYDAYGNLLEKEGDTKNEFLYTGEQYNANTGLYYLRARYMNQSTGTFISMDSYQGSIYDPVTLHKYLYANANPVMYTDPSGYSSETTLKEVATDLTVAGILASSFILANQVALNVFSTLRKNLSVASVVSENISVTQRDWKNLIIDFPSHNYVKEWIVTTVIWLSSWHLLKAIYEVKETDTDVDTPGVPEEDKKEKDEDSDNNQRNQDKKVKTNGKVKKPTSANQMNQQVMKGQAPREVKSVHNPDPQYAKPHVHLKDGTSISIDGTIHDAHNGVPHLSIKVLKWLHDNGWCLNLN